MSRYTRTFADIDLNFIAHPDTGDISKKFDDNAIKQSVKNLVLTNHYERLFHPEIGSEVNSLLFEMFTPLTKAMIITSIRNTIENFEPRVNLINVDVRPNVDNNSIYVSIVFVIVNTSEPITVNLILQRTR